MKEDDKYIYLVMKITDINTAIVGSWRNSVDAGDRVTELNEKEI